jgi:hypothetical protein
MAQHHRQAMPRFQFVVRLAEEKNAVRSATSRSRGMILIERRGRQGNTWLEVDRS